jgi:hypothetical protein
MKTKHTQLAAHVGQELYDLVDGQCEANGWENSKAVKIGIELFLEASHEQRIAILKRYKQRSRK